MTIPTMPTMPAMPTMPTMPTDFELIERELDAFLKPEPDGSQARRRERILRAATDRFVAHGYRKTSVEDIAGAAGVAKGTVYLYYQNKAELLLHAIAFEEQRYLSELAPVFDVSRSATDRVRMMVRLYLTLSVRMPLLHRSISNDHEIEQVLRDVDDQTIKQINAMQVRFMANLLDAVTEHTWSGERLAKRAEFLIDLLFSVVTSGRWIQQGMSLEDYADVLADVVVGGIFAPPTSGLPSTV